MDFDTKFALAVQITAARIASTGPNAKITAEIVTKGIVTDFGAIEAALEEVRGSPGVHTI